MKKYCTKHIRGKSIEERAGLASQYYIRARKAEDDVELLCKEIKRLRGLIDLVKEFSQNFEESL